MKAIFSTLRDAPRLGRKPVCFGALAVLLLVAAGCSSKKSNAVPEVRNDGGRHAESTMKTAASSSTMQAVSSTGSAVAAPTSGEGAQAMQPGSATGDAKHDWALQYERTVNGPEAELVVRTGDISNLGF